MFVPSLMVLMFVFGCNPCVALLSKRGHSLTSVALVAAPAKLLCIVLRMFLCSPGVLLWFLE